MNIVERILGGILLLLVVLGVIVMHIDPDEDADIIETQESTTCEEKVAPLIESKESEIIGGYCSGMPCEVNKVPEESEEETNEPATTEEAKQETREEVPSYEGREVVCSDSSNTSNISVTETVAPETHAETMAESAETEGASTTERVEEVESDECSGEMESSLLPQSEPTDEVPVIPCYSVNGAILDLDIQRYLYQRLAEKGIGWFMPYAVMIAYQESRFNPRAENANGQDKGLFQYRLKFYPGSDIFNPYEQIDIFTQQMANRANAGCSVNEMISRHMMSDYGTYNQSYVDQVLQHQTGLVLISN